MKHVHSSKRIITIPHHREDVHGRQINHKNVYTKKAWNGKKSRKQTGQTILDSPQESAQVNDISLEFLLNINNV